MHTLILTLALLIFAPWSADAQTADDFPGFRIGQTGWGAIMGWPFGVRHQRWLNWKQAAFYDVGYQTDGFVMVGANFSHYFLNEEDRWRAGRKVGTILYNAFAGGTAGYHIGDDSDERSKLGIRAGGAFEYLFPRSPWAIRAEVAPVLFFSGTTAAGLQGGIILMKYFGGTKRLRPQLKSKRPSQKGISAD
jgi:hypothetical protein